MPSKEELREAANADPTTSPYRVSVLYGDFGKRKTTTACSMVDKRGLLLSSDDSWKVLLNDRHSELYSKIVVKNLTGVSQFQYLDLEGYDTIIWDTLSQSVDVYLDMLYDEGTWSKSYREKIVSKNADLNGTEILAAMDYRVTRDVLRPVFNKLFKESNAHIIFTSQQKEPFPGLSADTAIKPSVPNATFKVVATRADIIANIRAGNRGKFVVDMTEGSASYLSKSRIEGLQGIMDSEEFVKKYKEIAFQ
jgi:AAA domain